ncbi:MAG TPA: ABC transporter ATP-binding protein [Candidatus Lustribacter sp.]|nr:ABC transporter ATP-binding protein [Candidatus Lustribacter sp.]
MTTGSSGRGSHTGHTGLQVSELSAGYGRLEVLYDIDLEVRPGEVLAVVGANGAGKTTVLRAISGLLRPSHGAITLNGTDITTATAERIASLGLAHVPENRLVFPSLSVADNLALGRWTRRREGDARAGTERVLALFPRLADRTAQAAGSLSGGEQQMLAIGRALMAEPSVVVLDEPSLGLAPRVVGEIMAVLAHLRADRGLAVLLVEQNVRAAFTVADHVLVMDRGRVVATGTAAELAQDERVRMAYLGGSSTTSGSIAAPVSGPAAAPTAAVDGPAPAG